MPNPNKVQDLTESVRVPVKYVYQQEDTRKRRTSSSLLPLGTVNALIVTAEQLDIEEAAETESTTQLARASRSSAGRADTRASTVAVKMNW